MPNFSAAGTYPITVQARLTNYPSVTAEHDFNIIVTELCNTGPTLNPISSTSVSLNYNVRDAEIIIGKIEYTPSYCQFTTGFSIDADSPSLPASGPLYVDLVSSEVKISSSDPGFGINAGFSPVTYTGEIYLINHSGIKFNLAAEKIAFSIVVTEPCVTELPIIGAFSDYTYFL